MEINLDDIVIIKKFASKKEVDEIKKQILENQEIVKRLKEKIEYYQKRGWETEEQYYFLLQYILNPKELNTIK